MMLSSLNATYLLLRPRKTANYQSAFKANVFNASAVSVSADPDGNGDQVQVEKTSEDKVKVENKQE
jgi:hypothetical protein